MKPMTEIKIPNYDEITKFGDALKEGERVGPGIRWAIPNELLPIFEEFKKVHRAAKGKIIARENILLKAVLYGLPKLLEEMEAMNQNTATAAVDPPGGLNFVVFEQK